MNPFWRKKPPQEALKALSAPNFAEGTAVSGGDLTSEFAVRQFWTSLSALAYLPNPDPILRSERISISTYRQMADGHLGAVTRKRRAAVRARPWSLNPNGAAARSVKRTQAMFEALDVRHAETILWSSCLYGYSVLEVMWKMQDGMLVPGELRDKPQEWFGWHSDGSFRFIDDTGLGEIVPERKFLVARSEPTFTNPYGKPLLSECFWPLAFKRGGLRFWMTFCEKYGMPRAIGSVPPSASQAERDALLNVLVSMVRDGAAVISDNQKVELQEAAGKASSTDAYAKLVQWADTEISKAILGETLSTELGSVGSLAAAQVHNDVRKDLALDDANLIEACFNELIGWIYDLNFPGESVRPRFEIQMPEDLNEARVTRDKTLAEMGLRLTGDYFSDTYRIDPKYVAGVASPSSASDAATTSAQAAAAYAEPGAPVIAPKASWRPDELSQALAAEITPEDMRDQEQEIAGQVLEMAKKANGFDQFMEMLETEYPTLSMPKFESAVEKFTLLGDMAGRTDAGGIVREKLEKVEAT